jgi:hemerythrin
MLLDKETLPLVAMEFMNEVHLEDLELINELFELVLAYEQKPNNENEVKLNNKYSQWFQHTVDHFKGEEQMMQERGFPPYPMHKGEHDNALRLMDQVYGDWLKSKDIKVLKIYLIETLPSWLTNHIQTMDTVTAMFFKTGSSPCSAR